MDFALQPRTPQGHVLIKLAEEHASEFAARADQLDRSGTYPVEHFEAMQRTGMLAACVPQEFGGLGVDSIHDLTVAISRLARGDASTALGACMHASIPYGLSRAWREAVASGAEEAATLADVLRRFGSRTDVLALAVTEPGTTMLHPLVEAIPAEGGWRIRGRKTFVTNAPIAGFFFVTVRMPDDDGGSQLAVTFVDRELPGVRVVETWDALGMRASGSHDLILEDCLAPEGGLMPLGAWGSWSAEFLSDAIAGTYPLLGAFLGIAEAAREVAVRVVTTRRKAPSGRTLAEQRGTQQVIAELEMALATARATLARTAIAIDAYFAAHTPSKVALDDLHQLMKDFQCTNLVMKRAAITAVDLALTASGGAGYLSSSPLSRLYRDVRAGPFMQPYSPIEAPEYIAKVTLGLDPALDQSISNRLIGIAGDEKTARGSTLTG